MNKAAREVKCGGEVCSNFSRVRDGRGQLLVLVSDFCCRLIADLTTVGLVLFPVLSHFLYQPLHLSRSHARQSSSHSFSMSLGKVP